jgi:hypothetical protein
VTVLIELDDGRCLVLPALGGYIGHCTIGEDGLRHVSYVPSSNHWRWGEYQGNRERIDRLRAKVGVAANHGRLWLGTAEESRTLAGEIRTAKGVDPSLGLYAAYAYSQAGDDDEVRSVRDFMEQDTGIQLFDVRMLATRPGEAGRLWPRVVPSCPLLTRGWNLIQSRGMTMPQVLSKAEGYLTGSLWTTFRPGMAEALSRLIETDMDFA